uniref:Conserved domain protein n=1 Tax=Strongyloides papillosus TaxID=174720 RepID=A0A0N5CAC1_STREA
MIFGKINLSRMSRKDQKENEFRQPPPSVKPDKPIKRAPNTEKKGGVDAAYKKKENFKSDTFFSFYRLVV